MKRKTPRRDAGRARGAPIAEAVLAFTLEELAEVGLEGLSIERIARRAEVNKTSVYRRWPTREALVAAALEGVLDAMSAQLPDTGSLRGDLIALLGPVAAFVTSPVGRALLRAALATSSALGVSELAARRLAQPAGGPVRAMVRRARARGEWRVGVRPAQLLGALVGAVIHRVALERAAASNRWLASLVDLTLYGALPRDPGASDGRAPTGAT